MYFLRLLFCLVIIVAATRLPAQENIDNLTMDELYEMSLGELMSLQLKKMTLLDVPHTHKKGELMISYKYMHMYMDGIRTTNQQLSYESVLEDYMVSPLNMTMGMQMLGVMYAPSSKITLMTMIPYIMKSMDHKARNGAEFQTNSSGLGDISLSALIDLYKNDYNKLVIISGFILPTGDINKKAATPMSNGQEVKLPYPMQMGTGTVSPQLGITYFGIRNNTGYGADLRSIFNVFSNKNDYQFGNTYRLTIWGSKKYNDWITSTLRAEYKITEDIEGQDQDINTMMSPAANPNLSGGKIFNIGLGINIHPNWIENKDLRFILEGKLPVYQKLNGPQLETDYQVNGGVILVI